MLLQIGLFLLQSISHLVVASFLLRFYAFLFRINISSNSAGLGQFLFAVTDWAVLPLRSFLPRLSRIDLSSLLPALAILLLLSLVKSWVMTRQIDLSHVSYLFIFDTLSLIITLLTVMLIIQAVLSWIQPQSHVHYFLHQLSDPLLRPIRNVMPLIGGIDLSPLVALLILQVLSMVIHSYKF